MRHLIFWTLLVLSWPGLVFAHESDKCQRSLLSLIKTASFSDTLEPANDIRGQIIRHFKHMPAEKKEQLAQALTRRHASREMTFQVKNETTGNYDKFVEVQAIATPAPILVEDYNRLVQSTQPLMKLYRSLLQKLFSQPSVDSKALGFTKIPASEAALAMNIIRESIYFEPKLIHPNMAEYPFLSVVGFDGAISDPLRPMPLFFETNGGTPSGISNNYQLLMDLIAVDPEFASLVSPHLPDDKTFALLRSAIESNARAWTKRPGISVIISPGVYNGAHPDVAAIARATGMPLVKPSDLYEDAEKNIRLNTGTPARDPVVTGIYGRMEESYFLQNDRDEIPMISPQLPDVVELEAKLGVPLRPGAIYDFIYDNDGKIVGINKDQTGRPKLLSVWSTIGRDPTRPGAPRGSFKDAIVNRKLYFSGLGGRVIDDKRLFRIFTQYLLPADPELARPIPGLSPDNLTAYFADPTRFVVKDPANSGGSGIRFPIAETPMEVAELNARVRARPMDFEIQEIATIATLPGRAGQSEVPMDLRIFVLMFANGHVKAGPHSVLLRTGAEGGLFTNTSRGGGYAVGLMLERDPKEHSQDSTDLQYTRTRWLAHSRHEELYQVLQGSRDLIQCLNKLTPQSALWPNCRAMALDLSFRFREILDLLDPWRVDNIARLRDFAHSLTLDQYQASALSQSLSTAIHGMAKMPSLGRTVRRFLKIGDNQKIFSSPDLLTRHANNLPSAVKMRVLEAPEIAYTFASQDMNQERKIEFAEYEWVDDPEVQAVIDEVKAFGGEVRWILRESTVRNPVLEQTFYSAEPAYFWMNLDSSAKSYLKPVIGIDLSQELSLASLHHELAHFRTFREKYKMLRGQKQDHESAMKSAYADVTSDEMILAGERNSVDAEIAAEKKFFGNPYMTYFGPVRRATQFFEANYINRFLYPEFEALRTHLYKHVDSGAPLDQEFLRRTFKDVIAQALQIRSQALAYWEKQPNSAEQVAFFRGSCVLSLLTKPFGAERLSADGTEALFADWLSQTAHEIGAPKDQCQ